MMFACAGHFSTMNCLPFYIFILATNTMDQQTVCTVLLFSRRFLSFCVFIHLEELMEELDFPLCVLFYNRLKEKHKIKDSA